MRLLEKILRRHAASDGVVGSPRMHETLGYEGETVGLSRLARLMVADGLTGVPQRRRWRRKPSGVRPAFVRNHLARDFTANELSTKRVVYIAYIRTGKALAESMRGARLVLWHGRQVDGAGARPSPDAEGIDSGVLATA